MKLSLQYLSDINGKPQAVQLPITDWEKIMNRLKRYEQSLKLKSNLVEAMEEVAELKKSKAKKQNLNDFLNEL